MCGAPSNWFRLIGLIDDHSEPEEGRQTPARAVGTSNKAFDDDDWNGLGVRREASHAIDRGGTIPMEPQRGRGYPRDAVQ
ncbi:hypothetical protein BQ8482_220139 [Mesorhizobium delmotii]|uniref:Uncharacterized protein n=1 Tax=Mesorhizobium delmotii TaxID=1631247 RepID=A0A2P9ALH6_9HYPH|nr:hypothetical protein BQ8482_220139 [Mesorhizobium delmotii]